MFLRLTQKTKSISWRSEVTQPQYIHDCGRCIFLGAYRDLSGVEYDLYVCKRSFSVSGSGTIIARFGNEGPHYTSGLPFIGQSSPLTAAAKLALAAGHLSMIDKTGAANGWNIGEAIQHYENQIFITLKISYNNSIINPRRRITLT